jgi:hypothetical protein
MSGLDAFLRVAASESAWTRVVHRCAWCGRVANGRGQWTRRAIPAGEVTTDGMCPACGAQALAQVTARRQRGASLAA